VIAKEFNKIQSLPKVETPWKYSFVDVTFEKYADYVKTKALLEIMAEYFKVLGNIKQTIRLSRNRNLD
jgi:prephenate dehydratase